MSNVPSRSLLLRIRFLVLISLAFISIVWQWFPFSNESLSGLEGIARDKILQLRVQEKAEDRVVIIDIDEKSIAKIGAWPWRREKIASLVETLISDYRVRHVGLDIVFPEPADINGDLRLQALSQTRLLTLAQVLDYVQREEPLVLGKPVWADISKRPVNWSSIGIEATGYIANHIGFDSAICVGNIGVRADADGTLRRVPLAATLNGNISLLLPLAMLFCDSEDAKISSEALQNLWYAKPWPVSYLRTWSSYTVIPAIDIVEKNLDPELLRGNWVLIGSSALGLNDRVATPLGQNVSGVMVHAATLSFLLDQMQGLLSIDYPALGDLLASIFIFITVGLTFCVLKNKWAHTFLPIIIALGLVWTIISIYLLGKGYPTQVFPPFFFLCAILILSPLEWWLAQRDQGKILKIFSSYVAPSVVQEMIRKGVDQPLTPQYAEITVLSADMQGYTAMTNRVTLEEAATLTRELLRCLTQPLLSTGGTLDKYVGDGLIGFWGAPLTMEAQADRALEAGVKMLDRIQEWNQLRAEKGYSAIRVRIGIETGLALVGDLGTDFRSTYTAVGDCINIASKLQSIAKNYKFDILVGPNAASKITAYQMLNMGEVELPGISKSINIFTVKNP